MSKKIMEKNLETNEVIVVLTWSIAILTAFLSASTILNSKYPILTIIFGLTLFLLSSGIILNATLNKKEENFFSIILIILGIIGIISTFLLKSFINLNK